MRSCLSSLDLLSSLISKSFFFILNSCCCNNATNPFIIYKCDCSESLSLEFINGSITGLTLPPQLLDARSSTFSLVHTIWDKSINKYCIVGVSLFFLYKVNLF
ncbi:hypothetical protein AAJ76_139000399 [Vairimorpha ceranae]|uniref:Uncharacterized protein n=1 Tax=Vairimorpha ceranae TaxID=40302 RepID=A0A0F9Z7U7_9MICR|nr:hypothetical protein AAJ76_139000399 [Vairimorpha ceranae]KKO74014.1 hypothetical protein AAJ76_139000399 [Vairimorpha ceranae]